MGKKFIRDETGIDIHGQPVADVSTAPIVLYKRADTGKRAAWQAYYRLPGGGSKRLSTRCRDFPAAVQVALKRYSDLFLRKRTGLTLTDKRFSYVLDRWLEAVEAEVAAGRRAESYRDDRVRACNRWFRDAPEIPSKNPLSGKLITDITDQDILDWRAWREKTKDPHSNRLVRAPKLNDELGYLRSIFRFAVKRRWLTAAQMPLIENVPEERNRRPDFTEAEWIALERGMDAWIDRPQKNRKRLQPHVRYYRQLLRDWVLTAGHCGLRVGEMRQLKWADITYPVVHGEKQVHIRVSKHTKKKQERIVIGNPVCETYFKRWRSISAHTRDDDWVFCHPDGTQLHSPDEAFRTLLRHLGLEYSADGDRRTLYSLRHTYCTLRLTLGNVNPFILAKNMGCGMDQLQRHYGHVLTTLAAKELTKGLTEVPAPSIVDKRYELYCGEDTRIHGQPEGAECPIEWEDDVGAAD